MIPFDLHDGLICFGAAPRTGADLRRDAGRVAAAIPPGEGDLLIVTRADRYLFAAALFGAWAAGRRVALPADVRRETVSALLTEGALGGLLHDTRAGGHLRLQDLLDAEAPPLDQLWVGDLRLHRAGGDPVVCSARQIAAEVGALCSALPDLADARTAVTVPPHHRYGLMCGLLAPLAAEGCVQRAIEPAPAAGAEVVVSVPAHLRGADLGGVGRAVSALAPLDVELAVPVTELFVTVATGTLAMREGRAFRPLPGVELSVDGASAGPVELGALVAETRFAEGAVRLPDRVALGPGGFLWAGRIEPDVVVDDVRLSLSEVRRWLAARDPEAGVVAAPAEAPRLWIAARSTEDLAEAVAGHFGVTPRVAAVPTLPRDDLGRPDRPAILRLFDLDARGRPLEYALERAPLEADDAGARFRVDVPESYAWFEGHFPGYPVMAGVVQLHELVLPCVAEARPDLGPLRALSRLKFTERIGPGDTVEVSLRWAEGAKVSFEIRRDATLCAGGTLSFG